MRRSNFRGARDGADVANLNVQTYVDARLVASIGKFLLERGQIAQTQYGRISTYCMRYFMQMLEDHYPQEVKRFEDTSEAIAWLGANGFSLAQFKAGVNNRLINTVKMEHAFADDLGGFFQPETVPRQTQQIADTSLSFLGSDKDNILAEMEKALARGEKKAVLESPEMQEKLAQSMAATSAIMEGYLAQQEDRLRPKTEEEVQANLREGTIQLLLKNATSIQQMPIPKALEPFTLDPSVIAEVTKRLQPYIEQRDREAAAYEVEKKRRLEETSKRQIGVGV